jgi:hypothetical protein
LQYQDRRRRTSLLVRSLLSEILLCPLTRFGDSGCTKAFAAS